MDGCACWDWEGRRLDELLVSVCVNGFLNVDRVEQGICDLVGNRGVQCVMWIVFGC